MGIFVDLNKAFDTINPGILLQKLKRYEIRGLANDWLCSYLSNRKQYVNYDHNWSKVLEITCGIPHGSNLGLLLFILNDIGNALLTSNVLSFANDTTLYFFKH